MLEKFIHIRTGLQERFVVTGRGGNTLLHALFEFMLPTGHILERGDESVSLGLGLLLNYTKLLQATRREGAVQSSHFGWFWASFSDGPY